MARGFRLGEIQNTLQVRNTHFSIGENEGENAQPGGIGTSQENLSTGFDIKMF